MNMKIETERLIVRKSEQGDRALFDTLQKEGTVYRGSKMEEMKRKLLEDAWKSANAPQEIGCMIFEKATGEFVGHISLSTKRLPPELGIDLLEAKQNQGYGPEAVRAFLTYFAYRQGLLEVQVCIWESNAHRRHMFEKLGAEFCERRTLLNEQKLQEIYAEEIAAGKEVPKSPAYLVYRLAC